MKLAFAPQQAGYSQAPGSEKAEVGLQGGRSWRRKTKEGASSLVEASWLLTKGQYGVFWSFYRAHTQRGVSVFQMDLVLEGEELPEVDCYFVGEPALTGKNGDTYTVGATLEVIRPVYDAALDEAVVGSYFAYGEGVATIFDRMAIFANEDMPDTLGSIVIPDFGFLNVPLTVALGVNANPFVIIPPALINTPISVALEVNPGALQVNPLVFIDAPVGVELGVSESAIETIPPVHIDAPVSVQFGILPEAIETSGIVRIDAPVGVELGIGSDLQVQPTVKINTQIGINFGIPINILVVPGEYTFTNAEAEAFIAAFAAEPERWYKERIDTAVSNLKLAGLWSTRDAIWPMWAPSGEGADGFLLNLKNPAAFKLIPVNSPTFTPYAGGAGNGTSSYYNTGWDAATNGSNYTRNNCSLGCWIDAGTDTASNTAIAMGSNGSIGEGSYIFPRRSGDVLGARMQSSSDSLLGTVTTRQGLTNIDRVSGGGGGAVVGYRNGSSTGTDTETSAALNNVDIVIGALNQNGSISFFNNNRFSCVQIGAAMGSTGNADWYDIMAALRASPP